MGGSLTYNVVMKIYNTRNGCHAREPPGSGDSHVTCWDGGCGLSPPGLPGADLL